MSVVVGKPLYCKPQAGAFYHCLKTLASLEMSSGQSVDHYPKSSTNFSLMLRVIFSMLLIRNAANKILFFSYIHAFN